MYKSDLAFRTAALVLLGMTQATACLAQTLEANSLPKEAGEMTHLQICERVPAIFVTASRPDEGPSKYRCRLTKRYILGQRVRVWEVRVGGSVSLSFLATTGRLVTYVDLQKSFDRSRGKNRTGFLVCADANQAKVRLRSIATSLGAPTSWTLAPVSFYREGENRLDKASFAACNLKNSQGEIVGSVAFDLQDGRLLSYHAEP